MAKAKFDIKSEAQRGLHAYVGVADLAIETVKGYVADARELAQKRLTTAQQQVRSVELQPQALRKQATTVVSSRVDELSKEAKARRTAIEKRVADLQADAQKFVSGNVETATDTYSDLAKRGESVMKKFQGKPATRETVANAKTTVAKAKTTRTQAKNTGTAAKKAVKKTVKNTAAKSTAPSSAKATGTAAKKTVTSAAKTVSS